MNGINQFLVYLVAAMAVVLFTYFSPPVILRMNWRELLIYTPLALLAGPAIHVFFSFFFGWHEYMPLFYVPWFADLIK